MNKTITKILAVFFISISVLSGVYFLFNYKYTISGHRSSVTLYDPNNKNPEQTLELENVGYFNNGMEQGSMDVKCKSWTCSYDLYDNKTRGSLSNPSNRIKINSKYLTLDNIKYYNAGYIKGYLNNCVQFRDDCENKKQNLLNQYQLFYGSELVDVTDGDNLIMARKVETRVDNAIVSYKIGDSQFSLIDTDQILNNIHLPVRENVVLRAFVSPNNKFIALEVSHDTDGGKLSYLIFEIDSKNIYKVTIDPFPFTAVDVLWLRDSNFMIQLYGDIGDSRGIVAEYFSANNQKPWEVKKKINN